MDKPFDKYLRPAIGTTHQRYALLVGQGVCWIAVVVTAIETNPSRHATYLACLAVFGQCLFALSLWLSDRRSQAEQARQIAGRVNAILDKRGTPTTRSTGNLFLDESLARAEQTISALRVSSSNRYIEPIGFGDSVEIDLRGHLQNAMTKSGMYDPTSALDGLADDSIVVGEKSTSDMVNRLDPRTLHWIESSPAEQLFLGWSLKQLRDKSFLEIIHPDDRDLAREQLRTALAKGEAHGLIYRVKNSRGESKAIQVNVGVRTGPNRSGVTHLRCHITDVTAKVRASRELRRRTRELTLVNQQLRAANRELEELKDRYSDLYQNAPALYFSLDAEGRISECNNTLLSSLGYRRDELIGKSYAELLPPDHRPNFRERFAEYRKEGQVEVEGLWIKANGEVINVFVTGTAVLKPDGTILRSRSVAQDVTARHALEAAFRDKNQRLGVANAELSRKIKELDEFSHVVSHDLKEPLRTLTSFSDFLISDYGDRLDSVGKEYVQYIVEASRRMRTLIEDLLELSRAGKVTADLRCVKLDKVLGVVKADLGELVRSTGAEIEIAVALPEVWGDRDRLVQLFMNLVSNGLKYNRDKAPKVSVREVPSTLAGMVTIVVQDNGIGIDPQFHSRVFQLFRRLHTREEYEGTGAGLAICQKIVQAHGGNLWVESELNHGSKFFVQLSRPQDGRES